MIGSFHTHSIYCDGKNTPEEMVQQALRLGCSAIGFTGHSNTPFDPGYCMDSSREQAYRQEVLRLKKAYQGEITIYLGLEQDYYSAPPDFPYEYLIGSVHYVEKNGQYLSVDDTPEILQNGVDTLYGGDFYALAEDYYKLVADVTRKTGCQVVGHMDLITKFNRGNVFFDEAHPRYRAAAIKALHALVEQKALPEINTGAMSRGYRDEPYPAPFLLEELGKLHGSAIVTTDAHRAQDLLAYGQQAEMLARKYGVFLVEIPPMRK